MLVNFLLVSLFYNFLRNMKNKWISALITFAVIAPIYVLASIYGADEKLFIGFLIGSFYDRLYKFILEFFESK